MARKHSIDKVRKEFEAVGYTLLTDEYKGVDYPLPFKCESGHTHAIGLHSLRKGVRCAKCKGNERLSIEYIKEQFSCAGYKLLTNEYHNNKQLLPFECNKGHRHQISYSKFRAGRRCAICAVNNSRDKTKSHCSLEQAKEEFLRVGYTPLFDSFADVHQLLRYKCDNNHYSKIRLNDLKKGQRCSSCVGGVRLNIEVVRKIFVDAGYTPLFDVYDNESLPLSYRCTNGHINEMSFSNFRAGNRCPDCFKQRLPYTCRLTLQEAKQEFIDVGYTPLFESYEGAHQLLPFLCDKGHKHKIRLHCLKSGERCRRCMMAGFSKKEKEIAGYFKELGFTVFENYKKIIGPKEVDLYFPDQKVAVEYCGLYWHSEISGRKSRQYHHLKRERCEQKGIRLITIFEDEFIDRPEVVFSRIKHALGSFDNKVYARKCIVSTISSSVAADFLSKNHLQGSSAFKIAFGLFYNGLLVGVMTGGSLSRPHTAIGATIEMKRFCFLPGWVVVGGASKLFKYFAGYARRNGYNCIKSYQDMRYGDPFSSVYHALGFELISETKYTPHYIIGKNRIRNQSLRKTPEERKTGKTEWELRREQGYDRIWDCGHRSYLYRL